jgi:arabinose-5-phosphate isomerase
VSLETARKVLEIEAEAIRRQIAGLGADFLRAIAEIQASRGRLCVTGIGKSGLAGQKIAATLASTGTPAYYLHAGDAAHGDLGMLMPGDVLLALSYSGETEEVLRLLEFAKRRTIRTIAITGRTESRVGRAADVSIAVNIPREADALEIAPTASTAAMLAVGDALALSISEKRGFRLEDFALLHPGGSLGRRFLKVKDLMRTADRIPSVGRDTPMPAAIHEMSRKLMGVTAVVDGNGRLFGVISDGDLRRLLEKDPAMLGRTAGECCRPSPRTVDAEEFARMSLQRMEEAKITSLFVVDGDGRLTGALHMHDLLSAGIA